MTGVCTSGTRAEARGIAAAIRSATHRLSPCSFSCSSYPPARECPLREVPGWPTKKSTNRGRKAWPADRPRDRRSHRPRRSRPSRVPDHRVSSSRPWDRHRAHVSCNRRKIAKDQLRCLDFAVRRMRNMAEAPRLALEWFGRSSGIVQGLLVGLGLLQVQVLLKGRL